MNVLEAPEMYTLMVKMVNFVMCFYLNKTKAEN